MIQAAPSHCSYMSLISCEYASSIHVACLKVPHFKEPTQHSSVQICTPGPEKDSKDKNTETQLGGRAFDEANNPTKSVIFMKGFFFYYSVFEAFSALAVCLCQKKTKGEVAEDELL